jgi:peptidoglycan hydrolase-like protein with peptidoglycan-binding domain
MPINASVGNAAYNIRSDVVFVQFLLTDWRMRNRIEPIQVDGSVGPETIGAILDFQKRFTPYKDGRVDPGGPTISKLEQLHLEGMRSGRWTAAAQKYRRMVSRNPRHLQLLYHAYLKALHDGWSAGKRCSTC